MQGPSLARIINPRLYICLARITNPRQRKFAIISQICFICVLLADFETNPKYHFINIFNYQLFFVLLRPQKEKNESYH